MIIDSEEKMSPETITTKFEIDLLDPLLFYFRSHSLARTFLLFMQSKFIALFMFIFDFTIVSMLAQNCDKHYYLNEVKYLQGMQ